MSFRVSIHCADCKQFIDGVVTVADTNEKITMPGSCPNPDCPSNKSTKTRNEVIDDAMVGLTKKFSDALREFSYEISQGKDKR